MVHSFNVIENKNGNTTVQFYQDNKLRQIIFTKDTEAQGRFYDYYPTTNDAKYIIEQLRRYYIFKANANNPSIFRPIAKSLILNS